MDNQGTLRRDRVLATLERQLGAKGLLDQSGRGLFLTYSLAGRLIFNLRRHHRTELVALLTHGGGPWPDDLKPAPILIFDRL